MPVNFWKMHGAANDFILIDDRQNKFPEYNRELIAGLCHRHTGIGSEGLILIRPSNIADFAMRFFNPDGNEADMCGNGARCIARLAYDLQITDSFLRFETNAGVVTAEISGNQVRVAMPPPSNLQQNRMLVLTDGTEIAYDFINTGVPHVIVLTDRLEDYPVEKHGYEILNHADFAPQQTNVDFVQIIDNYTLRVRTYERGVEAETPACGTGITASAVTLALRGLVRPPVSIHSRGGDVLTVDFTMAENAITELTLSGPAEYVFAGTFEPAGEIIPAPTISDSEDDYA